VFDPVGKLLHEIPAEKTSPKILAYAAGGEDVYVPHKLMEGGFFLASSRSADKERECVQKARNGNHYVVKSGCLAVFLGLSRF
jgi:hypothetical protein